MPKWNDFQRCLRCIWKSCCPEFDATSRFRYFLVCDIWEESNNYREHGFQHIPTTLGVQLKHMVQRTATALKFQPARARLVWGDAPSSSFRGDGRTAAKPRCAADVGPRGRSWCPPRPHALAAPTSAGAPPRRPARPPQGAWRRGAAGAWRRAAPSRWGSDTSDFKEKSKNFMKKIRPMPYALMCLTQLFREVLKMFLGGSRLRLVHSQ